MSDGPITDLDRPRMPRGIRLFNFAMAPLVSRFVSLEPRRLMVAARKHTGLSDFGGDDFVEPLSVLVDSLEREAGLSALGRASTRALLVQLLSSRLLIERLVAGHPEILDEPLERPLVIAGLPRTGTTHLHNLLAADSGFRRLPYWESLEPVAPPSEARAADPAAGRRRRAARSIAFLDYAMPLFTRMHEFELEAPHEEIQLLALSFSTMLFEASYRVPSYRDWYMSKDQVFAYRYLAKTLRVLQWLRGPRRWLLKSPQHLEQFAALAAVFPDAAVVQTHRDPAAVALSLSTMIAYGRRMQHSRTSARETARYWVPRVDGMLRASIAGRGSLSVAQVYDLHFEEFMADRRSVVLGVFEFAGREITPELSAAVDRHLGDNPRGKHGRVDYSLSQLGLEENELRRSFAFYEDRFGVSRERLPV